jgi:hypothetical protein
MPKHVTEGDVPRSGSLPANQLKEISQTSCNRRPNRLHVLYVLASSSPLQYFRPDNSVVNPTVRNLMKTSRCAVLKSLIVVGVFALASLPVSAQRVSADVVKNGHFPQALRGHFDRSPDKSIHHLSSTGSQAGPSAAVTAARPTDPPRPIVSPFLVPSSRSGSVNYGFMVGTNPFSGIEGTSTSIKTFIVPVVLKVHQVATDFSVDADNNLILTGIRNQDATYDPTQAAPACLGKTNNVPFTLAVQSPIFQNHHWVFGGTDLGNTQYPDAIQRANFWNAIGKDPGNYHIHLDTQALPPVVIDFPIGSGIGLPQSSAFLGYSTCAPTVLVDITLFDRYLDYITIPQLASEGVNSGNFPVFIAGNVIWGDVSGELPSYEPVAAGYHSTSSVDPAQTYGVSQFGDETVFTWPDAEPLSHEIAEWLNDPTGWNLVQDYNVEAAYNAAYDPTGPIVCQYNYEVGDILVGFDMPPVKGENGYTYTLQELAFFSYFYGGPSFAVNGWYSSNNTLTSDAGPVCNLL